MVGPSAEESTHLTWVNVGLGFSFILFNAIVSTSLNLGVGNSLVTSALQCVIQLAIMRLLLQRMLEMNNPWAVAGIACTFPSSWGLGNSLTIVGSLQFKVLLNFMGTIEAGE